MNAATRPGLRRVASPALAPGRGRVRTKPRGSPLSPFVDASARVNRSGLAPGAPPSRAAFDFENTVGLFEHAAIVKRTVRIDDRAKRIVRIESTAGSYGLVAITLEDTP